MADDLFLSVAGKRATGARLVVPHQGPWFVEASLDEEHELAGAVDVQIADLTLRGAVQPGASGSFAMGSSLRVVGGGGGWGGLCTPRHYHNDAGVKASTVATDAAALAGETLGTFGPGAARLGVDYVRRAVAASRVLEDAAGGVPWWVDYQGATQVRERPTGAVTGATVLDFDPRSRMATLAAISLAGIAPGLVLEDERSPDPLTIRDLEVVVGEGQLRIHAWCGGGAESRGRLGGLVTALARHAVSDRLWGKWRYRVLSMAPDGRVRLQAVSGAAGLPDVLPAPQWAGVAGVHAELEPGAEVLVEFVEGSPTMPVVVGFSPIGATGHTPVSLSLCEGERQVARVGDQVKVFMSPGIPVPIKGTVGGAPLVGTVIFAAPLIGIIEGPGAERVFS
jgi:hypothetical protein